METVNELMQRKHMYAANNSIDRKLGGRKLSQHKLTTNLQLIGLTDQQSAGSFGYAPSAAGWLCDLVKIPHL